MIMELMIEKIKKIQNKQQSLMWGSALYNNNEVVFAVRNKAYPKQPHFFSVTDTYTVNMINDYNKRILFKECEDLQDVLSCVISLLKEWFPAKGITENNDKQ